MDNSSALERPGTEKCNSKNCEFSLSTFFERQAPANYSSSWYTGIVSETNEEFQAFKIRQIGTLKLLWFTNSECFSSGQFVANDVGTAIVNTPVVSLLFQVTSSAPLVPLLSFNSNHSSIIFSSIYRATCHEVDRCGSYYHTIGKSVLLAVDLLVQLGALDELAVFAKSISKTGDKFYMHEPGVVHFLFLEGFSTFWRQISFGETRWKRLEPLGKW